MARSRSRSSDGASEQNNNARIEPLLLKAISGFKNEEAIALLESVGVSRSEHQQQQHDASDHLLPMQPPPTPSHLHRIALLRATERNNVPITEYLLQHGADPNGAGRASPLLKAVEKNHVTIVQLLLRYGGDMNVQDKQGRTALMTAAWKNHFHILDTLLTRGADVNKKDNTGRNVLHNLAADKHCNWGRDVIEVLLSTDIKIDGIEGQDDLKRSPLHWAAVTGKIELVELLVKRRANVNATEVREKTSLHLAVSHGRDDIVEVLLRVGADVRAKSDGSWTALHNACEVGNVKIVRVLLGAGAELNAKLLNGMTPLHVAAQAGHLEVVKCLLERRDLKRAARDTFGITPFLRAAQNKRRDIVNLLAPFNHVETLSEDALGACNGFNATIVDFGNFHNENKVSRRTVFELLYGRDAVNPRKPAVTILPKDSKATNLRWIHLPANNMAWVEALLTKAFIEEGANDVEGFKALERSFNHQHRGQQVHSHFMRPLCQSTPRAPKNTDESDFSDGAEHGPPHIVINGSEGLGINTMASSQATAGAQEPALPRTPTRTDTIQTETTLASTASGSGPERKGHGKGKEKTKKSAKWGGSSKHTKSGGTDTPTKQTDHNARQRKASQPLTNSGHLRSPGSPGRKDPTQVAKGNIFTFMPYLHFETDGRRQEMQAAIARTEMLKTLEKRGGPTPPAAMQRASTYDEMLLRAHLTSSTVSLHVRRTLDQFFYHNIDTQSRDQDQVVYRYQMKDCDDMADVDPKIFMVDQLWMWVLGKDLIVTAFPQRWQQPKNDPLNVLDGIIEDINSKTREPVRSVYDLAIIITGRCSGVFDRNRMDEDYQFLDMFESSIGDATEEETKLFRDFNIASAQASQWLQHHRRPNRFSRHLEAEGRVLEHHNRRHSPHPHNHDLSEPAWDPHNPIHAPLFVDKLLDIGAETDLLAETKDIRDELNMIAKVLEDQRAVLPDLELSITDIYREAHKSQTDLKRRFREQLKTIDTHIKDIDRMDKQAERIYKSITDLLDLKQKHANAFEARFARDQAAGTARQSQTIMVFTIVTIIFLPLSFIAAFFTINIREFPHRDDGGEPSLPLEYVSKYMFGIGFAVSIPLIAIALSLDAIGDTFREIKRRFRERNMKSNTSPSLLNLHGHPAHWDTADSQSPSTTSLAKFSTSKTHRTARTHTHRSANATGNAHANGNMEFIVDMRALGRDRALSAGRSTINRGAQGISLPRASYESKSTSLYQGGVGLGKVSSRGTGTGNAKARKVYGVVGNGNGNGDAEKGEVEVEVEHEQRPPVVERQSTGFRIRRSVEQGR